MSILEAYNHQYPHGQQQSYHPNHQSQQPQPQLMDSSPSSFDLTALFATQHSTLLVQLNEMANQQQVLGINIVALEETMGMVLTTVTQLRIECHNREIIHVQQLQELKEIVRVLAAQPAIQRAETALTSQPTSENQASHELIRLQSAGLNFSTSASDSVYPAPQATPTTPRELTFDNRAPPLFSTQASTISRDTQEPIGPSNIAQDIPQKSIVVHESTGARQNQNSNCPPSRPSKKRRHCDSASKPLSSNKKANFTSSGVGKGKLPRLSAALPGSVPLFNWSTIPILEDQMEELVSCDKCDRSFHYGCVNIAADDPVLQQEVWLCPPCEFETTHNIPANQPARAGSESECRVDCPAKDDPQARYAVESIIGRSSYSEDSTGIQMQYLIKWEGYPADRSSWTLKDEMSTGTHILIAAFEKAAEGEGLDLSDPTEMVLLQEATAAGWGYNTSNS